MKSTIELKQRNAVVAEAKSWLRTPYHHKGSIKGAGVDCAMILVEVYNTAGIVNERPAIGDYSSDWMMHRDEERYLSWVEHYATQTDTPGVGDIVVWKFGRCFSHGAIIIDYPTIIHAHKRSGMVTLDDASKGEFVGREMRFYTFWPKSKVKKGTN